jgi:hypothetical protein
MFSSWAQMSSKKPGSSSTSQEFHILPKGPLRAPSSSSLSSKSQWTVEVTGNRINEGVTKGSSSVRGIMGGVLGLDYSSSEEEDKT